MTSQLALRLCCSCARLTPDDVRPGAKLLFAAEPSGDSDDCNLCAVVRGCYLEYLRTNLYWIHHAPKQKLEKTTPQHLLQLEITKVTDLSTKPPCTCLVAHGKLRDTWFGDEVERDFYFHSLHSRGECILARQCSSSLPSREYGALTAWADLALAKMWLHRCSALHDQCQPVVSGRASEELHPSTRLIDTKLWRIVSLDEIADPSLDFVALSYVWGTEYQLRTTTDNLDRFRKRLPIFEEGREDRMPRTIMDAMTLTGAIGYRFLWVDALCIIQDSSVDLAIQLAQMDRIYGLAALTVVARATRSSDSGLPGVSIPRNWLTGENLACIAGRGNQFHVGSWDVLSRDTEDYEEKHGVLANRACYMWRGWTFQEQILSNRVLEFSRRRMVFWCGRPEPELELGSAPNPGMRDPHHFRNALRLFKQTGGEYPPDYNPDHPWRSAFMTRDMLIARWRTIRDNFSTRHFTFPSDRRNAVLGTATMLRRVVGDIDSSGHVLSTLGNELLWHMSVHPSWNPSQAPAIKFAPLPVPQGMFPSWSWLSLWPLEWPSDEKPVRGVAMRIHDSGASSTLEITARTLQMILVEMEESSRPTLGLAYRDGQKADFEVHLDGPSEAKTIVTCVPIARTIYSQGQWYDWCYGMLLLQPLGNRYRRVGVAFARESSSGVFKERMKSDEVQEKMMLCI